MPGVIKGKLVAEAESLPSSSTTGTWAEKLSLPFNVPAGRYRIEWSAMLSTSATIGAGAESRIQVDDITELSSQKSPSITGGGPPRTVPDEISGFAFVDLSAGAHQVDIDFQSRPGGGGTAFIQDARLAVYGG